MKQDLVGGQEPQKTVEQAKPLNIHIHGRRWFDKVNGNTYHTTTIFVNGEFLHKTEYSYGYGDQYSQTAADWLHSNGYLADLESYKNGGHETLWRYCERKGIKFIDEVDDLPRKRDL